MTLVFYRIGNGFALFSEPFLNIMAAAFQMSSFTHVEVAIGKPTTHHPPPTTHHPPPTQPPSKQNEFLSQCLAFDPVCCLLSCTGNEAGSMGQMSNVCRIFNDELGVITSTFNRRTKNPAIHHNHTHTHNCTRVVIGSLKQPSP